MTNEASEDQDLEAQMRAATEALRATVLRLLRLEVHPQLIVLAVAQVAAELAASAALAGGEAVEPLLDKLTEVVRHAGRGYYQSKRFLQPAG
jgi:hypothetical protein